MPKWYSGRRYLPEPVRFEAMTEGEKLRAARLTARFIAQRATSYAAWPVPEAAPMPPQALPRYRPRRAAVIDEAFDRLIGQLAARGLPWQWVAIVLYHRSKVLLDQHDGIPAHLFLTGDQFAQLQEHWRRSGLPEDLYFPAEAERVVTEPVAMFGGLVLGPGRYSPLQSARREAGPPPEVSVPGEEERELALIEAGVKFIGALGRRRAELTETGRVVDDDELVKVNALSRLVASLLSDTNKRLHRRRSEKGQHSPDGSENN
jgi:hypothetical protein